MFTFVSQKCAKGEYTLSVIHTESGECIHKAHAADNGELGNLLALPWHPMHILCHSRTAAHHLDVRSMSRLTLLPNADVGESKFGDFLLAARTSMDYVVQLASYREVYNVDVRFPLSPLCSFTHDLLDELSILVNVPMCPEGNLTVMSDGCSIHYQQMNRTCLINCMGQLDQSHSIYHNAAVRSLLADHIVLGERSVADHLSESNNRISGLAAFVTGNNKDVIGIFSRLKNGLLQVHHLKSDSHELNRWSIGPWIDEIGLPREYQTDLKEFYVLAHKALVPKYQDDTAQYAASAQGVLDNEHDFIKNANKTGKMSSQFLNQAICHLAGRVIDEKGSDTMLIDASEGEQMKIRQDTLSVLESLPKLRTPIDKYTADIVSPWLDVVEEEFSAQMEYKPQIQ